MTLLVDNIMLWARKMAKSFSTFDDDHPLDEVDAPQELPLFFEQLEQRVERFFTQANADFAPAKLWKVTSQACGKEYAEQQKLMSDKEFIRVNCRVPASLDAGQPSGRPGHHGHHAHHGHHGHGHGHGHHHGQRTENEEDRN